MERDIAGIVGIAVRGGRYSLREAFTRCMQICLVMNMEEYEWDEVQVASRAGHDEGNFEWKIDAQERLRARAMV